MSAVCVCVLMCVIGCFWMFLSVSKPEADMSYLSLHLIFWDRVSHWTWNLMIWLNWLSNKLKDPVGSNSTEMKLKVHATTGGLLCAPYESNTVPRDWVTSTLLTEPSSGFPTFLNTENPKPRKNSDIKYPVQNTWLVSDRDELSAFDQAWTLEATTPSYQVLSREASVYMTFVVGTAGNLEWMFIFHSNYLQ